MDVKHPATGIERGFSLPGQSIRVGLDNPLDGRTPDRAQAGRPAVSKYCPAEDHGVRRPVPTSEAWDMAAGAVVEDESVPDRLLGAPVVSSMSPLSLLEASIVGSPGEGQAIHLPVAGLTNEWKEMLTWMKMLPEHTQCPDPVPPTKVRCRPGTRFSVQDPGAPISMIREWTIHPLAMSQILSFHPPNRGVPHVNWLNAKDEAWMVRFGNGQAWRASWKDWTSWVVGDVSVVQRAVSKAHDSPLVLVVPASQVNEAALLRISAGADLVLDIPPAEGLFQGELNGVDGMGLKVIWLRCGLRPPSKTMKWSLHQDHRHTKLPRSPFERKRWAWLLRHHPDPELVFKTLDSFRHGRSARYDGDRWGESDNKNSSKLLGHEHIIEEKITQEREKAWKSGPYQGQKPFINMRINPRSITFKKSNNKPRFVIDMSSPRDGTDVNSGIGKAEQRNVRLSEVADLLSKLGKNTILIKFDVVAAYKLVLIAWHDWHLHGEGDGKSPPSFDFCTVMPFGSRRGGFTWEDYGKAIEFMIRWNALPPAIVRYVDDFLVMIPPLPSGQPDWLGAQKMRERIEAVADFAGVPLDKWEVGCELRFLGITVDTVRMRFVVPEDKLQRACKELAEWEVKKSVTRSSVQSLLGTLIWLCSVVRWGRAFVQRIIALLSKTNNRGRFLRINKEFRKDVEWWQTFLPRWPGISLFCGLIPIESQFQFFVDASSAGHGALFETEYFSAEFTEDELRAAMRAKRDSIPFKEMLALRMACATFGPKWKGRRIVARSDNQGNVDIINKKGAKDPALAEILRQIAAYSIAYNFDIVASHVSTKTNIADALSRFDLTSFFAQVEKQGGVCSSFSRRTPCSEPYPHMLKW
jgi:hypothetical protein